MEFGLITINVRPGLFGVMLRNNGLELFINLLFDDIAFIKIVLAGPMDETPLSTTST